MDKNSIKTKIKIFWEKYEAKIVLILGFVLVAVISFEAGTLKRANLNQKPLVIEKPALADSGSQKASIQDVSGAQILTSGEANGAQKPSEPDGSTTMQGQNCAFLGSKNSNLYHLPTSSYAKRIKVENRICFSSADDAKSKGYSPDKSLAK